MYNNSKRIKNKNNSDTNCPQCNSTNIEPDTYDGQDVYYCVDCGYSYDAI